MQWYHAYFHIRDILSERHFVRIKNIGYSCKRFLLTYVLLKIIAGAVGGGGIVGMGHNYHRRPSDLRRTINRPTAKYSMYNYGAI